jgi:hypothetical protein
MSLRFGIAAALLMAAGTASAGGAWGGALGGLGEAMQGIGQQMQEDAQQREMLERQHQLEMGRIRYEYEMQRQAQERQAAQARASEARRAQAEAKEIAQTDREMEMTHPGWRKLVNTRAFDGWMRQQPGSVKALADSTRIQDAKLLIDLFKRDTPSWQAAK